jgi:hypothetical protein
MPPDGTGSSYGYTSSIITITISGAASNFYDGIISHGLTAKEIELIRLRQEFEKAHAHSLALRASRELAPDPRPVQVPSTAYRGLVSHDRGWMVHRQRNFSRCSPSR